MSAEQLLKLARRARADIESTGDRRLAEGLLARTPPRAEYAALFMEASSAQRTLILLAVQRAELGKPRGAPPPGAPSEAIAKLERFALTGEFELFSGALAETLGCSNSLAEKIAADRSGELLAVTLAAIGTPNDVSVRILTSSDLRDGADYRRVGALARLQDALSPSAAQRVISAIIENRRIAKAPPRRGSSCRRLRRARGLSRRSTVALARFRFNRHARSPCRRLCSRRRRAFAFLGAYRPSRRQSLIGNSRIGSAVVAAIGLNATPDHAIARRPRTVRVARRLCRVFPNLCGSNAKLFQKHFGGLRDFKVGEGVFDGLDRSDLASDDQMPASRPLFLAVPFPTFQ